MSSRLPCATQFSLRRIACILFLVTTLVALGADAPRKAFDIPAAAAEKSLKQFAAQAGVEVLFSTEAAAGIRTNSVKGQLTPLEAITQLVAGTRLVAVPDDRNGIIRISRGPDPNAQGAAPPTTGDRPAVRN